MLLCTVADVNECQTGQHTCSPDTSSCNNTIGNFTCKCGEGYTGTGYRHTGGCKGKRKEYIIATAVACFRLYNNAELWNGSVNDDFANVVLT